MAPSASSAGLTWPDYAVLFLSLAALVAIGGALHAAAARHRRFLPRPPPYPVVGGLPVLPRHRDQRGHHHLGACHRLQRELAVRAVLHRIEPGQASRGLSLHPRLLPPQRDHHLRVPAAPLRRRQPGHGLAVLLRDPAAGVRRPAHGGGAGGVHSHGLAALGDPHALHRDLHRLYRAGRGERGGVDQCLPGDPVPGGRARHGDLPGLPDRGRPRRDVRHRGGGRAVGGDQLGAGTGRSRLLAACPHRSEYLLARGAQRTRGLGGRLRHRSRSHAATAHRGDAEAEPADPHPHPAGNVGDAGHLSQHRRGTLSPTTRSTPLPACPDPTRSSPSSSAPPCRRCCAA